MISTIWNISLFSSLLILFVIVLRIFFRRYPKSYSYILWFPVLFRLLCPIVWESNYSLFQEGILGEYQENAVKREQSWEWDTETKLPDNVSEKVTLSDNRSSLIKVGSTSLPKIVKREANSTGQIYTLEILKIIYLLGLCLVALGYFLQYLSLRRKLSTAVMQEENIRLCDQIETPFVIGIVRPLIYLPFTIDEEQRDFVLAHERAHIKYGDHIVRALGILTKCIYWWNPLVWLSVSLMYHDMEMCCDERVLKGETLERKKEYAGALLHFAAKRDGYSISLPFGETNTEKRIRNILLKKSSHIFLFLFSMTIVVVSMIFLLTTPVSYRAEKNLKVVFQYQMDYWKIFDLKNGSMKSREMLEDTCLRYIEEIEDFLGLERWWERVNPDADTLVINLAISEGRNRARLPYPGLPKEVETMIQLNVSTISNPNCDGGLASMLTGIMIGDSFSPLLANGLCGYAQKQIGTDFVREFGLSSQEIYEMCVSDNWDEYGLSHSNYEWLYAVCFVEYLIETYGTEQVIGLILEGESQESYVQLLGKSFEELQQDWLTGGK